MKFQDLIDNREESAKRARQRVSTVCNTFENRKSGSEQEAQTSAFLKDQLQNVCEVKQEFFDVYPEAYSGVFYIVPTFALLATVAYFYGNGVACARACGYSGFRRAVFDKFACA